jgi:hypothetical protein
MNTRIKQDAARKVDRFNLDGRSRRRPWRLTLACVAAVVVLAGAALPHQQPQAPTGDGGSIPVPQASSAPDATPLKAPEEKAAQQTGDGAGTEPSQQIAEDSARLLKLATDLKAEVDKTNKDTLSLRVVRKADEIERLAHAVRARIKIAVAAN